MKELTKKNLIDMLKRLLKTDADIEFLLKLTESELETLISLIRDRMDG